MLKMPYRPFHLYLRVIICALLFFSCNRVSAAKADTSDQSLVHFVGPGNLLSALILSPFVFYVVEDGIKLGAIDTAYSLFKPLFSSAGSSYFLIVVGLRILIALLQPLLESILGLKSSNPFGQQPLAYIFYSILSFGVLRVFQLTSFNVLLPETLLNSTTSPFVIVGLLTLVNSLYMSLITPSQYISSWASGAVLIAFSFFSACVAIDISKKIPAPLIFLGFAFINYLFASGQKRREETDETTEDKTTVNSRYYEQLVMPYLVIKDLFSFYFLWMICKINTLVGALMLKQSVVALGLFFTWRTVYTVITNTFDVKSAAYNIVKGLVFSVVLNSFNVLTIDSILHDGYSFFSYIVIVTQLLNESLATSILSGYFLQRSQASEWKSNTISAIENTISAIESAIESKSGVVKDLTGVVKDLRGVIKDLAVQLGAEKNTSIPLDQVSIVKDLAAQLGANTSIPLDQVKLSDDLIKSLYEFLSIAKDLDAPTAAKILSYKLLSIAKDLDPTTKKVSRLSIIYSIYSALALFYGQRPNWDFTGTLFSSFNKEQIESMLESMLSSAKVTEAIPQDPGSFSEVRAFSPDTKINAEK